MKFIISNSLDCNYSYLVKHTLSAVFTLSDYQCRLLSSNIKYGSGTQLQLDQPGYPDPVTQLALHTLFVMSFRGQFHETETY